MNDGLMKGAGLFLEGGAMRGIFTAGVLDAFQEEGIYFLKMAAISAGSLQAVCYTARQPGRNRRINLDYSGDPRYMGFFHLFRGGSYFNFRFMFGELAHELDPFDYETFAHAPEELFAVITECASGRPVFISSRSRGGEDFMRVCEASCSIPLFSQPVSVDGVDYVDGGVGMPLAPLPGEFPFPCRKPVYILTRDAAYRKKPAPRMLRWLMDAKYGRRYPAVVDGMCSIPERYNARLERLLRLEAAGEVFVIRPERPVRVSRVEKDREKLDALYREGFSLGKRRLEEMRAWLHEA